MRAMIVAAGLGTRMQPLTKVLPKPACPVRGLPLVTYQLELLAHHGVTEVILNSHHLPNALIEAAERYCPPGVRLEFSRESALLGTGGGIRRAADFLRESDPCLIVGGDMILDADLTALRTEHEARGDAVTLLLRRDPREAEFGSIGVDADGRVRRIGSRFDLGGVHDAGVYVWANVVSARAFDTMPEREAFGHLDDWLAPRLRDGARDIRANVTGVTECFWEPVGTLSEYLRVNLATSRLSYINVDARAQAAGTRFEDELVIGSGASMGQGAQLRRAVVWEDERVPEGLRASDGVFAGGAFHPCPPTDGPGARS
ncbi:MAG: NDP-sugar synthase [Deltaproteobacteria bacterium]|nr:NDP-sugar synthase [Deltaproteobacteria bacterium]